MIRVREKFSLIVFSFLFSLLVLSCAKDRSIDSWKNDKLDQQLASIQAQAGGVYAGALYDETGKNIIGPVSMKIESSTIRASSGSNSYKQDETAVVRGTLVYGSDRKISMTFEDGVFDPTRHSFRANFQVVQRNGNKADMLVMGTINGGKLDARVIVAGYPVGGQLVLSRNNTQNATLQLPSRDAGRNADGAPGPDPLMNTFVGQGRLQNGEMTDLQVSIMHNLVSVEEEFLNFFLPHQVVQAGVKIGSDLDILFGDSQWDPQTGSLIGRNRNPGSATYAGSDSYELALYCNSITLESGEIGMHCRYISTKIGVVFDANFAPTRIQGHR